MQAVVRTKLFDIITDPRENEYVAQRKALTFVDKWGDWSQDWRSFDRSVSLGKDKARQMNILSLIRLLGRDRRMPEAFDQISGTNADNSWKSWWRFKSEGLADKGLVVAFMDKLPTGFSTQDTHSSPKRAPLPFRALPVCVCCTTCAMIAIIFHKHIFVRPCLRMYWTNMSRQTLYVFKVEKSSQKILQQWT